MAPSAIRPLRLHTAGSSCRRDSRTPAGRRSLGVTHHLGFAQGGRVGGKDDGLLIKPSKVESGRVADRSPASGLVADRVVGRQRL